jgi:hypothetical protein
MGSIDPGPLANGYAATRCLSIIRFTWIACQCPSTRRPQRPRIQSPRYSVQRLNARRADLEYDGYQPGQSDTPGVGELLRGGALQ